jgi:hypothetical protein
MDPDFEVYRALDLDEAREAVLRSADDCVVACREAVGFVERRAGNVLKALAGVAAVASEHARTAEPVELVAALSLCARMIESRSSELEGMSGQPEAALAASAAWRCASSCRRALVALYDTS